MKRKNANIKILAIFSAVIVIGGIISFNVFFTTISGVHLRSGINVLEKKAGSQDKIEVLHARRGMIRDRNGSAIAQDQDTYTIVAVLSKDRPGEYAYVEDREFTAQMLAPILGMDENVILSYLNAQDDGRYQTYFGEKGKNLTVEQKKQIEAIEYTPDPDKKTPGLPGIEFEKTVTRVYTPGKFASTLLGFASYDSEKQRIVGQVGIEAYLDEVLKGQDGKAISQKDGRGYTLPGTTKTVELAKNGGDVYLTLDKDVQQALETCLEDTMKNNDAERAWAVVMEVETGKILGYGGMPTYDLNSREEVIYFDMPSMQTFEPGSIMKPFAYASAIEEGVYRGDDTVLTGRFCISYDDYGRLHRDGSDCKLEDSINDAWREGWGYISFDEGLIRSSNTCIATLLTEYLNKNVFWEYLDKLGFFKPTGMEGIEMSEEPGIKNNTYELDKIAAGFGQGSTVTTLQLLQAYTALFNDGYMVKPYYVDKIVENNHVTYESETTYVHTDENGEPVRIYSEETISKMNELMKGVIQDQEKGTGRTYNIPGFDMLGKTGTGEIASAEGGYSESIYTSSIMAAAPASDPKIMVFYGFQSKHVGDFDKSYFKNLFTASYEAAGIKKTDTSDTSTSYENWQEYTMPSLKNHTVSYIQKKLESMNVHTVFIGDGNIAIDQYPSAYDTAATNQNVFIKTNSTNITMPNMINWSYKDVMLFKQLSGLAIECSGSGIVKSQSITENTAVTADTQIIVELE